MTSPVAIARDPVAAARALGPELVAHADEADRMGRLIEGDVEALRRCGLLGLMVPLRLGGQGASFSTYTRVATEIAKASGSVALVFNMHASVTGAVAQAPDELLMAFGAPDEAKRHRDEMLKRAAEGAFYAVAMSERGAGARLSSLATLYREDSDGFRITGTKAFVSGADIADSYLVAARSDAQGLISFFLVPRGEGVRVNPTWDALGMRATGSHDVEFDVVVPRDALVGGVEGVGQLVAEAMPQWLVASYAAVYVGVARAAIDAAVDHVTRRALTHLPAIRARIGRADALVAAADAVVQTAAEHIDSAPGTQETNRWVWRAKLMAGDVAAEVAASMLEAAGSGAMRRGVALERLYRDARCGALQPATSDVCADWLGLATLGLDPDHAADVPRW